MPYIITTSTTDTAYPVSRVAVATLEEARETIRPMIPRGVADLFVIPDSLDPEPLTIGPLPDGTIIGVELATWEALREMRPPAGCTERNRAVWPPTWSKLHQGEIILAFNAS